ncbi:MAG: OadG-related small transporter subunit [Caldiserica bacterium]|nr:OadG-related small transporter subunit [Caldisericota bacterium]
MDLVVAEGLRISGLSYALIFVVLGIFYGLIKLLLRMFPPKNDSE